MRRPIAAGMVVVLAVGLLTAAPAQADPSAGRPAVLDEERIVDGRRVAAKPRKPDPAPKGPAAKTAWPGAGIAKVAVSAKTPARAGNLPIWVMPPAGRAGNAAGAVNVRMLDRTAARKAGVDGVVLTMSRSDKVTTAGRVGVRLDYSGFAQAFGGSYGSRLRLVRLPGCALTAPQKAECRKGTPVATDNDAVAKTLTADVEAAPAASLEPTVLATAAAGSGSQGDYKATSLSASATWNAGGNSGDFTWSYPMRVPPVPGGLTPSVGISYSSGSVDGRTGNANSQPSWVGEGFDLWPGYIERVYKSCEDDGAPKDEWGNSPGDQCWGYDNATLTWNGKGGELVPAGAGKWRMKDDDGTRIEKLTDAAVANGDNDNEYWKVTTTDGTQYYFGNNKGNGSPETKSTWTTPVFGDDNDEPCNGSTFATSWCQQAWRWNLDYVVDPNGNAITYTYVPETNYYGRNLKPEDETPYERGGYLKEISYGLREGNLTAKAPAKVVFDTSERCIRDTPSDCDPSNIATHPDYWWDVPWDMNCNSGQECKETHGASSPTFWSRKRLTKVTTQVIKADSSGHRNVDSWSMEHTWRLADVDRDLVLDSIQHTGHAGTAAVSLPKVTFLPVQMPNRLDRTGDDILPYIRYRVGTIYDESGGQIDINYSDAGCSLDDLPTPQSNTQRCFPVRWQPPGRDDPITDWFHKYVVDSVVETDRTGLAPDMNTRYEYLGGAAWHFDDDDGLTKEKNKTWSQWRGYGHVRVKTGDYNNSSTQEDTFYLRGMDGDRLNADGGEKDVNVSDGEGGSPHPDHESLSGFTLKTVSYDGVDGAVLAKTVNSPWHHQTASRTRSWGTVTANLTGVASSRTWTALDGGAWRQTRVNSSYDTTTGRPNWVDDLGDTSTPEDDQCTRTTYADDATGWMLDFPSQEETVSVTCADTTPDRETRMVSDVRTFYDAGGFGAAPTKGDVTRLEKISSHNGSSATYVAAERMTYDGYGRSLTATDAANNTTTTAYTDTAGLNTKVTVTSPQVTPGVASSAHVTSEELDPAWGLPIRKTGPASTTKFTDLTYDSLGRLFKVWLPDRPKASNPTYASLEFGYRVVDGQIVAITTKTLTATGGYREGIELFDGWLRSRQTQSPGPDGRLIADTFYDDRGQVAKKYLAYTAAGAPETALFGVGTPGNVETQTVYTYDGVGRVTTERLMAGNNDMQEKWRTTTTYGGDRASVDPPVGGTPTTTITDARGQTVELRQYKGAAPSGEYDATKYTHTSAGQLASVTDPAGNEWTYTYDLRGRKTETTDPDKGTTTFGYDDLDRLVSTDDARTTKDKVFTSYDVLGRKKESREGAATGPLLASWTYDSVRKGSLTSSTRYVGSSEYTSKVNLYDDLGRAKVSAVSIPAAEGALQGNYVFSTVYNLDGTVQSTGHPAAGGLKSEGLVRTYDDYLRPAKLFSEHDTYVNLSEYSPTGKPWLYELGNTAGKRAWQRFTWEYGTQRLATSRTNRENITGADRNATYDYDDAGNILSASDASRTGTDTQCFGYDHLRRLAEAWTESDTDCSTTPSTSVVGGPAPYWQSFTYDATGNRTKEVQHGAGAVADTVRTHSYAQPGQGNKLTGITQTGAAGDRTDSFFYNETGNTTRRVVGDTTQTMDWDAEGELTKVTDAAKGTTSFVYDADGNRLIRKDPGGATLYLPGMELRLDNGATASKGTRYYTYGGQTVAMRTSAGVQYLSGDHQGTSQLAINAADQAVTQRRFTPFGAERGQAAGAWPGEKGFVGGTIDASTGLTHLGAREYDPNIGRFISVDPLFDLGDPQSWNGYAYADNSPVTNSDPDGLMCRYISGVKECSYPPNHTGDREPSTGERNPGGDRTRTGDNDTATSPSPSPGGCSSAMAYMSRGCNGGAPSIFDIPPRYMPSSPPPPPVDFSWSDIWRDGVIIIGLGICTVASAGTCAGAGVVIAVIFYAADVAKSKDPKKDWRGKPLRDLGINVATSAGGGYLGKVLTKGPLSLKKGWFAPSVSRKWPEDDWIYARRKPVNWRETSHNLTVNSVINEAGCTASATASGGECLINEQFSRPR
ncbi:sugar-binding protein [Actinomadura sp. HBU206391]|nr:RHS repeat-associated core domain-containing protein [Actinomadura sp. HBU206391]MBC6460895.1 sugar-binding protein [Actinomadura sp. HBU206391]